MQAEEFEFISSNPRAVMVLREIKPILPLDVWIVVRDELLESAENIFATIRSEEFWEMILAQGIGFTLMTQLLDIIGMPKERRAILGLR